MNFPLLVEEVERRPILSVRLQPARHSVTFREVVVTLLHSEGCTALHLGIQLVGTDTFTQNTELNMTY